MTHKWTSPHECVCVSVCVFVCVLCIKCDLLLSVSLIKLDIVCLLRVFIEFVRKISSICHLYNTFVCALCAISSHIFYQFARATKVTGRVIALSVSPHIIGQISPASPIGATTPTKTRQLLYSIFFLSRIWPWTIPIYLVLCMAIDFSGYFSF